MRTSDFFYHWKYRERFGLNAKLLEERSRERLISWNEKELFHAYQAIQNLDEDVNVKSAESWKDVLSFSGLGEVEFLQPQPNALKVAEEFKPWKKGPFKFGEEVIDSEWRSDLKWNRIQKMSGISFEGKRVADIGCANGYFMFRLLEHNPELVVGFEPVLKNFLAYDFLYRNAPLESLQFEPLGIQDLDCYEGFFDVLLCLGILYHHTDPVSLLRLCRQALRPKGKILIEMQGMAGHGESCLVPAGKYAGAKGVWSVPEAGCVLNWIKRSGFQNAVCFYNEPLSVDEQRSTPWAPINSLKDFLNESDRSVTVEGYPAPSRIYIVASK